MTAQEVLNFWFHEIEPAQWWRVDPNFDAQIDLRFGVLLRRACRGELFEWRGTAQGRLAEIIVLDQFSRNVFRNTPQAFAQDAMALILAQEAVSHNTHLGLPSEQRAFLLMPYMHSESPRIHEVAADLFQRFAPPDNYQFELRHKAIIDRFGRYPHRNAILGRDSSPEELTFLQEPGSRF